VGASPRSLLSDLAKRSRSPFSASSLASTVSTSRSQNGPDTISAVAATGATDDRRATATATEDRGLGASADACEAGDRVQRRAGGGGGAVRAPPEARVDGVCIARKRCARAGAGDCACVGKRILREREEESSPASPVFFGVEPACGPALSLLCIALNTPDSHFARSHGAAWPGRG